MDPTRLMNQTGTISYITGDTTADEMGNPTETIDTGEYCCWLWQTSRSENTANADVQQETFLVGLDPAAEPFAGTVKTIEINGVNYDFEGPPWPVTHPRSGVVTHLEATVRRTR